MTVLKLFIKSWLIVMGLLTLEVIFGGRIEFTYQNWYPSPLNFLPPTLLLAAVMTWFWVAFDKPTTEV